MHMWRLDSIITSGNEMIGKTVLWLMPLLTCIIVFDVFMRYALNNPTIWAYDVSYMIGGTFFILGMGYTLAKDDHVRVDIFWNKMPARLRRRLEIGMYAFMFFPVFGLLTYSTVPYVIKSWVRAERSIESFWRPVIYPFKTILLVGIVLLLIQGFAIMYRDIREELES